MTDDSVNAQGREVIAAIRGAVGLDFERVTALMSESNPFHLYTAIALTAAMVRWASHETGKSVDEILDELAGNYGQ